MALPPSTPSSACKGARLYDSLRHCKGTPVVPGIRRKVYFIPKDDIVAWPTLPKTPAQGGTAAKMADLGTLTGNFTLASDKKWRVIDTVVSESSISGEPQGEPPYALYVNKATFKHPGNGAEGVGFAQQALADDFVYLVQQQDGRFRLVGNEMFETSTQAKWESGSSGSTDKAGMTIEVSVNALSLPPFYPGEIITEEGKISGETGLAIA